LIIRPSCRLRSRSGIFERSWVVVVVVVVVVAVLELPYFIPRACITYFKLSVFLFPKFTLSICSAVAQEEVSIDYQILEYLLQSGKVSPNVVNRFGNGLVYTAFVGANMRMLNLLQRV
jgi:hypothetical protein